MTAITMLVILTLFSALAFWAINTSMTKIAALLFMILAGVAMMSGLKYYDLYVNDAALGISLMLVVYCFVCLGMAYASLMIRRER